MTEPGTAKQEGFCDGCRRGCPLSSPGCRIGMEKAGMEIPEGELNKREGRGQHAHGEHGPEDHEAEHGRGRRADRHLGEEHGPEGHGTEHGRGRRADRHPGEGEEEGSHKDMPPRHRHHEHDHDAGSDWFADASEDELLMHRLRRCGNHFKHAGGRKSSQIQLLSLLSAAGGSAVQSELGEKMNVRRASVSELVVKLESRGLVSRRPDEKDRRTLIVSLTPEGEKALSESGEGRRKDTSALFSPLTEEEKQQLGTLLDKLLAGWKD